MAITPAQARAELARRELAARNQTENEQEPDYSEFDAPPKSPNLLQDILIGLTHAGRNIHNLPHDIVHFGDVVGSKIGRVLGAPELQNKNSNLASYLPYDESDYSDVFGVDKNTSNMFDKLIQGGIEHAPEIASVAGLARHGLRRLMGTHQLDTVEKAANASGLNFKFPEYISKEAERYLPESMDSYRLLEDAIKGKYTPNFKMQSAIGGHQRNLQRSLSAAENRLAPRVGELKQEMTGHLQNILKEAGMHKEADQLKQGLNNYRIYKQFMNKVSPLLKKKGVPASLLLAAGLGYEAPKIARTLAR